MKNRETQEEKTLILGIEEREKWMILNPDWDQKLSTPRIVSGIGTALSKTDGGWKDTLKRIKSGSGKNNTINT